MNYCIIELEHLAVVAAVKHFSFYLRSKPFKVVTDQQSSLLYVDKMKDSKAPLMTWALSFLLYKYEIVH